ncbi:acetylcholinesterase-1-like [Uloborus diversus]|uniref:acetylcholinesterase-1-like n=1 Tax=Uloborus diversus TaxID=327109 RepID=UPI00240A8AF1|nr:acetylcholinesterase-1-like [Uloborus diversus]
MTASGYDGVREGLSLVILCLLVTLLTSKRLLVNLRLKMSAQIYLLLLCLFRTAASDRVVMTNNGPIQGVTQSADSFEVEAFLGIPYAEPPMGRLRFMKPVPKTSWSGVLDGSILPPPCIQNSTQKLYFMPDIDNMSEDCLYLNVWIPATAWNDIKLKPVLFFIHGGAFNIGSSNMQVYNGAKMAAFGDVVVVTINYRIGVMGFFSAFIDGAVGNMGLYDQVQALKWFKANAESFRGDPEHIVLMGESAGAMCVSGHLTSPLTKNLFKRAILQSGADISPIIMDDNERVYQTSQKLAKLAGCADKTVTLKSNPHLIVACLKRLPADELSRLEGLLMMHNPITFFPRVGDEYMPKASIFSYREGNIMQTEILVGINDQEGTFFLSAAAPQYFGVYGANNVKTIGKRLAYQMTRVIFKNTEQKQEAEIADFYINTLQNATSDTYTYAIAQSLGDWLINCASVFFAELNSLAGNNVYYYVFKKRPDSSPLAEWMGTTHFDEIQYVFGNPLHDNFTKEEVKFSRRMMARWISFIKKGDPNIQDSIRWEPFSLEYPEYLLIDSEESVHLRPTGHRCEFWRDRFHADITPNMVENLRRDKVSGSHAISANFIVVTFSVLSLCFLSHDVMMRLSVAI